jgi:hypothetical protein
MNFSIGNNKVGKFLVWVVPTSHSDYFDCLITEEGSHYPYYVNLHKDVRFPMEFKFPPKPLKKEIEETIEEKIYRIEHDAYAVRKDMCMPMWVLHKTTLEKVLTSMERV